ncbi:hypothetical protein PM082_022919 [Marasmius tenuissimus]|nr:hypothetical protein PM082_022919 [Marasmius tenuissimus]
MTRNGKPIVMEESPNQLPDGIDTAILRYVDAPTQDLQPDLHIKCFREQGRDHHELHFSKAQPSLILCPVFVAHSKIKEGTDN